jgi:hypothetical protein
VTEPIKQPEPLRPAHPPADYFVSMSMLVTGRHKGDHPTLGKVDVIARDIALEEAS